MRRTLGKEYVCLSSPQRNQPLSLPYKTNKQTPFVRHFRALQNEPHMYTVLLCCAVDARTAGDTCNGTPELQPSVRAEDSLVG